MCITYKNSTANLKLTVNLIVWPATSTVNGELYWVTGLQNQEASGLKQRLFVCVISVTHWSVSNVATRILICTKKNLGTPTKLFRHYAFCSLGTPDTPLRTSVWETPMQTVNLWCLHAYKPNRMDHAELTTSTAANNVPWTNSNNDDRIPHPHRPTYTANICVQGQSYVTIWEQILEDKLVLYNVALVVDSTLTILTH